MVVCVCVCVLCMRYCVWLWCVLSSAIPLCPKKNSVRICPCCESNIHFGFFVLFCTKSCCKRINRCTSEPKETKPNKKQETYTIFLKWSGVVWSEVEETHKKKTIVKLARFRQILLYTEKRRIFCVFFVCQMNQRHQMSALQWYKWL